MEERKNIPYNIIAGILFAVLALMVLAGIPSRLGYFTFTSAAIMLLTLGSYSFITLMMFLGRRDIFTCIGFGAAAFAPLVQIVIPYFTKFGAFLSFVSLGLTALILTAAFTGFISPFKKVWFLPAVISLIKCFGIFIYNFILVRLPMRYVMPNFFDGLVLTAAILCSCIYAVYPDGFKAENPHNTYTENASYTSSAYCGLAKHVLLLLFTFGIWNLIWVYRVTEYTNAVNDEAPRKPGYKLLLYMFVPFYGIYWTYETARRIDKLSRNNDIAVLCLLMSIFVPIAAPIIMQDKINALVTGNQAESYAKPKEEHAHSVAEELREYKSLLDDGIITQEEFEKKKQQLLNL